VSKFLVQLLFIAWQLVFMTQLEHTRERFLFIEQLPLLYVDLPLRFRPLGHSAFVTIDGPSSAAICNYKRYKL
jgi:hypothetical protein